MHAYRESRRKMIDAGWAAAAEDAAGTWRDMLVCAPAIQGEENLDQ